jgi:hypothetical protein
MSSTSEALDKHLDLASADLEAVARVAGHVQLVGLHLRYMNTLLGPLFPDEIEEGWQEHALLTYDAHLLSNRDIEWEGSLPEDQTGFVVRTMFRAEFDETWVSEGSSNDSNGEGESEDREELDFSLMAVFDLNYELREAQTLSRRDLEHFAAVNSVFNAWPYWRELAHSTTQRMGITPPLVVPVFTVSPIQTGD